VNRPAAATSTATSLVRWAAPVLFAAAAFGTGLHAASDVGQAISQSSAHEWLVAAYGLLRTVIAVAFAAFTIGRPVPRRHSRDAIPLVACAVALSAVVMFADPEVGAPGALVLGGEIIATGFCVWLLVSVLFLGRCFGVLPEARGLITAGPYRIVRHPVYLGEIGACAGLALAAFGTANAVLLGALIAAQLVRMRWEERALADAFPAYAAYSARTPRLVPRMAAVTIWPSRWGRALTARSRPLTEPTQTASDLRT
jgi:protein-S-isoprenylcysteine O-methyltransferase Ste14